MCVLSEQKKQLSVRNSTVLLSPFNRGKGFVSFKKCVTTVGVITHTSRSIRRGIYIHTHTRTYVTVCLRARKKVRRYT